MPKIYKAANVLIDSENKVQINVRPSVSVEAAAKEISTEAEPPEARAVGIIEQARKEAAAIKTMAVAEAEAIKKNARDEAAALTAKTRVDLEAEGQELRKKCELEGYKEGYDKGESAGEALRQEAQKVLDDAIAERDEIRKNIEPDAVVLIVGITEKLLGTAAEINPSLVTVLIRQGFAEATLSGDITVRVSKEDYEAVMADKEEIISAAGSSANIEIIPDGALNAADCLIETSYGVIDCGLTQQYKALCENLKYLVTQIDV